MKYWCWCATDGQDGGDEYETDSESGAALAYARAWPGVKYVAVMPLVAPVYQIQTNGKQANKISNLRVDD